MFMRITLALLTVSMLGNVALLWRVADWSVFPAALIAWYLVDFASGLVHILLDYAPLPARLELDRLYFHPTRNTPEYNELKARLLRRAGPYYRLAYDFKTHHPRPDAFGERSFMHVSKPGIIYAALPASLALNIAGANFNLPAWFLAFAVVAIIGATFVQYCHSVLHRAQASAFVRALRRVYLLMTPAEHQKHHDTIKQAFCMINGWANPVVDAIFKTMHRRGIVTDGDLEPPRVSRPPAAA